MLVLYICRQNKKKPVVGCHNRLFWHFVVSLHSSGQMVVKKPRHSARSIPKERFCRGQRRTILAGLVLLMGNSGSLFHKCFDFQKNTRSYRIEPPTGLIENTIRSIENYFAIFTCFDFYIRFCRSFRTSLLRGTLAPWRFVPVGTLALSRLWQLPRWGRILFGRSCNFQGSGAIVRLF